MVVLFTKIIRKNLWGFGSGIGDAEGANCIMRPFGLWGDKKSLLLKGGFW